MTSKTTQSALQPNTASALCYVPFVGWIAAVVLLIIEKNSTVRWNAVQSLLLMVALWVAGIVLGVTIILAVLSPLVWVGGMILQLVLAVKAYNGETMKLPVISGWVDKVVKKV